MLDEPCLLVELQLAESMATPDSNQIQIRRISMGLIAMTACIASLASGCSIFAPRRSAPSVTLENPLFIPQTDVEFVWNQIVDELDNYFKIRREDRVRIVENLLTEGWIETFPKAGSTLLEPWRKDSTPGFERRLATLQSMRRWARVRVIPETGGFRIEVIVFRELEDLDQPEKSYAGNELLRYDDAIDSNNGSPRIGPDSYGWIPIGRDEALEQRILENILARLTNPAS